MVGEEFIMIILLDTEVFCCFWVFFPNSLWQFLLVFLYFNVFECFFDCDLIFEAEGISYIIRIWVFTVECEEIETDRDFIFLSPKKRVMICLGPS